MANFCRHVLGALGGTRGKHWSGPIIIGSIAIGSIATRSITGSIGFGAIRFGAIF
jgi:hypothetical protein